MLRIIRMQFCRLILLAIALLLIPSLPSADASEHHGSIHFNELPVPGVTVTAMQGEKCLSALTNLQGVFSFSDLADGMWTLRIEMMGFQSMKQEILIGPDNSESVWELSMLPFSEIKAETIKPSPRDASPDFQRTDVAKLAETSDKTSEGGGPGSHSAGSVSSETSSSFAGLSSQQLSERAANGFLVNGSVNNGAASPFALRPAFGNNRFTRSLYNGSVNIGLNNSALDARSFSLTGQNMPKPDYNRSQISFNFGGPLRIPHLDRNQSRFFLGYQRMRDKKATVEAGRMPTLEERAGDLSQVRDSLDQAIPIFDPQTGSLFENNVIPQNRISSQARALLSLFPLPNSPGGGRYNYQIPIISANHQDSIWGRISAGRISGNFNYQTTRSDNPNIFGFQDTGRVSSLNIGVSYFRALGRLSSMNLQYRFERNATRITPYFANGANISDEIGISGNNQEPENWGPPNLLFSNFARLTDAQSAYDRNQSNALSGEFRLSRRSHFFTAGMDFRRQQLNSLSQQDARGTFTFTGTASGYDFADFLLGIPSASAIAFGNADKYFRASNYAAYINDDWRVSSGITLNVGIRWEYEAPFTELQGRLVNLDIAAGFTAAAPILAGQQTGQLTGRRYPDSLIQPDKRGIEPRIGFAWRPRASSSIVVRGGYGIYRETSVYLPIARRMAQQSPFSKNLSAGNTASNPLTLADGFHIATGELSNTFGIDPGFRVGYAQNWQLSMQRDFPFSLQIVADYMGARGNHLPQKFYPNTYPEGAVTNCTACPSGFVYIVSNGTSIRHAGSIQLRRRLGNGFLANVQYTYSKSLDDSGLSEDTPAQNWLDLKAERALSNFDQRHLLTVHAQYTSGIGIFGSRLLDGMKGLMLKEWTITGDLTVGSGLPLTPVYAAVIRGTGHMGSLRPSLTGASIGKAPKGLFLSPAAYAPPPIGEWGNAGRNSINGPKQFSLNASLGRGFRLKDRYNIEFRLESNNILNHATSASWNTTTNSSLFGLPDRFNPMRKVQASLRVSF